MRSKSEVSFFSSCGVRKAIFSTFNWLYERSPINFSSITGYYHPSIPRLSGHPILGRATQFINDSGTSLNDELKKMSDLAKKDERKMCYGSMGHMPFIFITNPSDIQQVLIRHKDCIDRSQALDAFTYVFGDKNIFGLPTSHAWKQKRAQLKKWIFTPDALDSLNPQMQTIVDDYIKTLMDEGSGPSLEQFMTILAMDLFSQSVLGTKPLGKEATQISKSFAEAMKVVSNPNSGIILKLKRIAEHVLPYYETRLDIQKRRLDDVITRLFLKPNETLLKESENFLQHHFANKDNNMSSALQDASAILLAGHETTSRLLQFSLMALAQHPVILEKLRDEIERYQPEDGNWSREILDKMHYLRKILKETLRLYPPVPVIPRMVTKEFYLRKFPSCYKTNSEYQKMMKERNTSEDIKLTPDTLIFIGLYQTHRLSEVYDCPDQFNPARFESPSVSSIQEEEYRCAFLPFGLGQRDCIGRYAAIQEAQLSLIKLVSKFDFKFEEELSPSQTCIQGTLKLKHNIPFQFTERDCNQTPKVSV